MAKVASSLKIRVTCHFGRLYSFRTHLVTTYFLNCCLVVVTSTVNNSQRKTPFLKLGIGRQSSILFPRNNLTTVSKIAQLRPERGPFQRQHLKERRIRRKYFKQSSNHLRRENDCEMSVKCFLVSLSSSRSEPKFMRRRSATVSRGKGRLL